MQKINIHSTLPLDPNDNILLQEIVGLKAPVKDKQFSIANIVMKPGTYAERHLHQDSEEAYIVTRGSASMIVNGETFAIAAGDVIVIVPGDLHEVFTGPGEELEFMAITVPAYTPEDFLRA
jgi:uncharacterized protein